MIRLIQASPDDLRACDGGNQLGLPSCVVGMETVVWVGLDRVAVDALVNDCGQDVGDEAIVLLRAMVESGDIDITREFRVTASVTMTGTVHHTVEAVNESEAAEKVSDLINDGGGIDDFMDYANIDDVLIDDVEDF
jgi:hypothetical protein